MRLFRSLLEKLNLARGKTLPPIKFENIWSIRLFTADGALCSEFQKDLRSSLCGCKWAQMRCFFADGLEMLNSVQKMGVSQLKISELEWHMYSLLYMALYMCSKF